MKSLFYFLNRLFLFAAFLTSCRVKPVEQSNKEYLRQLSCEIENTKANVEPNISDINAVDIFSDKEVRESNVLNSEKQQDEASSQVKSKINQKLTEKKHLSVLKNMSASSGKIDKDNTFWKIGQGMIKVGIAILSIGGGVYISSNGGGIQFFGLLIGLAVIILALPFFLLAAIMSNRKRSLPGKEKSNEDEI